MLLQLDAGRSHETSAVGPLVLNAWVSLNAELTRAQIAIPTTIENVLDLGCEILVTRDDIQTD